MLGVTTFLSTDVAAIPLFWVIPLSLYLLSFIIVFARVPAMVHRAYGPAPARLDHCPYLRELLRYRYPEMDHFHLSIS